MIAFIVSFSNNFAVSLMARDFTILTDFLNLNDFLTCRIQVAIIFFLTSAFFHSFTLQALYCFFKITFYSTLPMKKKSLLSLHHIFTYILLILISWFLSAIILIPAFEIFNLFSYFPKQYHCLILFTNIRGFIYSLLSTYIYL